MTILFPSFVPGRVIVDVAIALRATAMGLDWEHRLSCWRNERHEGTPMHVDEVEMRDSYETVYDEHGWPISLSIVKRTWSLGRHMVDGHVQLFGGAQ